jgi:transposase
METQRRRWEKKGLYLYYLPSYSPKLSRIEILWKHVKYFWRRFVSSKGTELFNEIQSLMNVFGTEFTVNFA